MTKEVDINKIKTIEDIKVLIKALLPKGIKVADDYSKMDDLKHLLMREEL